jgi:DNA replication protein DnaC
LSPITRRVTEFIINILEHEIDIKLQNRVTRKIKEGRFQYKKYLSDFELDHYKENVARKIIELKTLDFIRNKENIILVGNPGTGKSHLAIALGLEACMQDMSVLFTNIPNIVIELKEAMSLNQILNYRRKFEKYDLVILDELGYVSFDKESIELLFNLLSNRNTTGSVIITTNLVFERWDEVFKDTTLTSALIDRLVYKSHVIDMSGDSFRIKETQRWLDKKA